MALLRPCPDHHQAYLTVVRVFTTACNVFASAGCFYTIIVMLRNKHIRRNTFNIYVIFLILPDAINTLMNFVMGLCRLMYCGWIPREVSSLFDFTTFFYYFANFFLNCCVAYELNRLLERSHKRMRTGPPPMKRVVAQISFIYFFAIVYVIWGAFDFSWSWWYRKRKRFGSPPGGLFSELGAMCMTAGIMLAFLVYVIAIRVRIRRRKLIPKKGRTKVVSLFFERIIVVFLIFYFPSLTLLFLSTLKSLIFRHKRILFWIENSFRFLAALQACVTLREISKKPDIEKVVFGAGGGSRFSALRFSTFTFGSSQRLSSFVIAAFSPGSVRESGNVVVDDPESMRVRNSTRISERNQTPEEPYDSFVSATFLTYTLESEWLTPDVYDGTDTLDVDAEEDCEIDSDNGEDGDVDRIQRHSGVTVDSDCTLRMRNDGNANTKNNNKEAVEIEGDQLFEFTPGSDDTVDSVGPSLSFEIIPEETVIVPSSEEIESND